MLHLKLEPKPDWLLFVLAHELGHIGMGHLATTKVDTFMDESFNNSKNDDIQESEANIGVVFNDYENYDTHENEANNYALSLITPDGKDFKLHNLITASKLMSAAVRYGIANKVSPGHVILSAARHTKVNGKPVFSLGNAALKLLADDIAGPPVEVVCRKSLLEHVDLDQINSTNYEFLEKMKVL